MPASLQALREHWARLTSGSVNRRVFGAALVVGTMTVGAKLVSLVKESYAAALFGTSSANDALVAAVLVPTTIAAILAGSLNAALIPTYIETSERESPEAAHRLYTSILLWNTAALAALTFLLAGTVSLWLPLITHGYDPAKLDLTRRLVYGALPLILLQGFATTWGALLNAGERFALVAIAPALQPLGIIAALALLAGPYGIWALLGGTLLGAGLETAALGVALTRKGHPLLPRWHGATPAFRKVLGQYGACIGGSFLGAGMSLVDQAFASTLGPGSNSSLNYGGKLVTLVVSLGVTALGTAVLPQLSRMAAQRDWTAIRRFLRLYMGAIFGAAALFTGLLMLFSGTIVRTMYEHGSFTAEDTSMVVKVQIFYLFRVPFAVCGVLVTRTLTALRANQLMLYMSIFTFGANVLFDWLFIQSFGIGGITLATSVCSSLTFLVLTWAMYRTLARRALEDAA